MALKDYNSSNFKNSAMDRMSGSFGKGPGDGVKKSTSTTSASLPNPWAKPGLEPTKPTSIKKPSTTPMPAAKPSTTVSTTADKSTASSPKTMKDVRSEGRMKIKEAKNQRKLDKINNPKTEEEKSARNKKIAGAVSSAAGAVVGTLDLVDRTRQTFPGKNKGN